jgi:hypothetical protein
LVLYLGFPFSQFFFTGSLIINPSFCLFFP